MERVSIANKTSFYPTDGVCNSIHANQLSGNTCLIHIRRIIMMPNGIGNPAKMLQQVSVGSNKKFPGDKNGIQYCFCHLTNA